MITLFRPRILVSLVAVTAITMSASCVIRLTDQNAPALNGDVTGPAMNCNGAQVLPRGTPGGNAEIKYLGRFVFPEAPDPTNPDAPPPASGTEFDWSGNNITVRFQGTTKVTAKILLTGTVPEDQLFEFVVDKLPPTVRQITVKTDPKTGAPTNTPEVNYEVKGLSTGPHELTIWKNTEVQKGSVIFQGFDLNGGTMLPPTRRPRKMEVIGDSIICGYGIEGQNATCPFEITIRKATMADGKTVDITLPVAENQFLSFTSQAARALDADLTTMCWSGKGVYKNYKENPHRDPTGFLSSAQDSKVVIPELWEKRTLGNDSIGNIWDFTKEKPENLPQVVFVSLGTNDFSRDNQPPPPVDDPNALPGDNSPDGDLNDPADFERFTQAYSAFVEQIRLHRPDAHIFLATPPMLTDQFPLPNSRSKMRGALNRIAAERAKAGDNKVYAMDLVEMGFRYGLGCDYHPNLTVHNIMAEQLVGAIKSKTCWN